MGEVEFGRPDPGNRLRRQLLFHRCRRPDPWLGTRARSSGVGRRPAGLGQLRSAGRVAHRGRVHSKESAIPPGRVPSSRIRSKHRRPRWTFSTAGTPRTWYASRRRCRLDRSPGFFVVGGQWGSQGGVGVPTNGRCREACSDQYKADPEGVSGTSTGFHETGTK